MNIEKLAQISVIFIALCLVVFLLKEFAFFLRPFIIAFILSFTFVPLTRMSKKNRAIVIILISLIIVILLTILGGIIGNLLLKDADTFEVDVLCNESINATTSINSSNLLFLSANSSNSILKKITFISPAKLDEIYNNILSLAFSSLTSFISEFFLVIIFLLFMLPSHDLFMLRVSKNLQGEARKTYLNSVMRVEEKIKLYLFSKTVISLGTALASLIVMFIFNVEYKFLFSLIIFLLNFIPNIGSIIAVLIVLFSYFLMSGMSLSLVILAFLLTLIQMIFGNYLEPKYMGFKLKMSPIIVLLSLFFWGSIWGVSGMLFSVPLTSIFIIVLENTFWFNKIKL